VILLKTLNSNTNIPYHFKRHFTNDRTSIRFLLVLIIFSQKGFSTMNQYPIRYAFRLDPATEAALEQIARHAFQSKASIMRRYVQEGVKRESEAYSER
jgi:hypothetical protein